jgi:hypothetical protein
MKGNRYRSAEGRSAAKRRGNKKRILIARAAKNMPEENPWSTLPQSWTGVELPGYRDFNGTYATSPLSELPPIPIDLDDDCQWLKTYGRPRSYSLSRYERNLIPSKVVELAKERGVDLPASFRRFMTSPDLHALVPSCTDCYLDPGERVVETVGAIPGHLLHFLSDSQGCAHWYLHVIHDGRAAVLESEDLFCYPECLDYPTAHLEQVELNAGQFRCCALTFSEFLYRFWIENEIWFALAHDASRRPLTELELAYVNHYASRS